MKSNIVIANTLIELIIYGNIAIHVTYDAITVCKIPQYINNFKVFLFVINIRRLVFCSL